MIVSRNNIPHYIGHRKRLKEKYRRSGFGGWLDYEVLEFALSFAIPRKDVKPLAKELITRFKTLDRVLDADIKDVREVKGIGEHTALFLKLLKDISLLYFEKHIYNKDVVSSPQSVYNYLRVYWKGKGEEELLGIFLNNRNSIIAVEKLTTGTVDKAAIYPRKVVERTLYHNASRIIVAHNHPGGSLEPSEDDREVTRIIKEALSTIEVPLLDHLIVTQEGYFSFHNHNLL